ncbi:MAG: DNA repair and recombination protein RadA [Thermoproteota archaeon]|nr:MAG: DNA repair and recombination protein RadA [Candidatus Korarchaeota archaeon]RLG48308.1 MAG: DNA repair and recombination protein RadA [Candidatus Korarchaeota archaeon]
MSEEEDFVEVLKGLPGVGNVTAKKLIEAGYVTLESIALSTPAELVVNAGLTESTAKKVINSARQKLSIEVTTAYDYYLKKKETLRITTGSKNLDDLLGGGVETQAITEIYGPYGSGKTQLAHQLAVTVQLPVEKGGIDRGCLFIDTEGTFRPERVMQIAEAFDLDPGEVLKRILYARAYTSDHQILVTAKAEKMLKKENIGLIVVDSLISHFRGEYTGRETLAERQQKLNKYIHMLLKYATGYNLAVLVTNQVMADPSTFFGDPTRPTGGHVIGHGVTTRLYIRRGKEGRRVIKLTKSPYLPEGSVEIMITDKGIVDI